MANIEPSTGQVFIHKHSEDVKKSGDTMTGGLEVDVANASNTNLTLKTTDDDTTNPLLEFLNSSSDRLWHVSPDGEVDLNFKGLKKLFTNVYIVSPDGGCDYTSPWDAIAEVTSGTILVLPGTYYWDAVIADLADGVNLIGVSQQACYLRDNGWQGKRGPMIRLNGGHILSNFTLKSHDGVYNGSVGWTSGESGGAVYIDNVLFRTSNAAENATTGYAIGAIDSTNKTSTGLYVTQNTFIHNQTGGATGDTIYINYLPTAQGIADAQFELNTFKVQGGHDIYGVYLVNIGNGWGGKFMDNYFGALGSNHYAFKAGFSGASKLNGTFQRTFSYGGSYYGPALCAGFRTKTHGGGTGIELINASDVGWIIRGAASQSGNLQEWQDSSANILAQVDANGGMVINEQGADTDTRVEGDTDANLFYIDAGADNVGIGVADPDTKLEIFNAGNQLKLSFDGTDNAIFGVDTNGDLTITPSGSNLIIPASKNISLATTTGTKIGTGTDQLLGFYNATPVNQPDTVSDSATQDLTGADTVDRTKLEADLSSVSTAVNTIIDRLQELGLIA